MYVCMTIEGLVHITTVGSGNATMLSVCVELCHYQ
jgi:hypothetical protein